MRLHAILAVAASCALSLSLACGSSSNGNGGSGTPTCQGAPPSSGNQSTQCGSCLQGSCGPDLTAAVTACGTFYNCIAGCQCTDLTCLVGCTQKIDQTCQNAYGPLATCQSGSCSSQCGTGGGTDSGATE
jgi:hypothetical protein